MRALQLVLLATLAILTSACSRSRDGAPTPRPEPVLVNVAAEDETDWSALLAGFTADTGIPVTLRPRVSDTLVTAVVDNSEKPPADVLITPSARGVWHAADEGATRPIRTAALTERVPDQLRDPDGLWTALAYRAIAIVAATPVSPRRRRVRGALGARLRWPTLPDLVDTGREPGPGCHADC